MKKYVTWVVVGVALAILIALAVWASAQAAMVPRSSEAWSRGQIIGRTPVKRHVALQPAPDGGVFLIWQNLERRLELVHIGMDGDVLLNRVLPAGTAEALDPQLQVGADGRLRLLWLEGEANHATAHYVLLEADGTPVNPSQMLSDPASPVLDTPQLIIDAEGRYHTIWADGEGIQWATLSAGGTLLSGPTMLVPQGRFPSVRTDNQGRLHLAWQRRGRARADSIYYAVLDPESGVKGEPEEIAQIILRTGQVLRGPIIGLTPETGYVLWEIQDYKYVFSMGGYAFFPLGLAQQRQIEELGLREGRNPAGMCSLERLQTPLLVALSESVPDPEVMDVLRSQIAVVALEQGKVEEQVATASIQASLKPTLVVDDNSHLHLAWLETTEFGEYRVVYASTAPEVMKNYDALTLVDVLDAVFSNLFRLSILVVALVAVLIIWALLPFLVLLVYHLVTSEETLDTVRSRVALVVVLVLVVVLTFAYPPRIGVEASWPALRWAAPVVAAAVAALVTVRVARRQKYSHLFTTFFLFTGVNSLVQVVMYLLL
ncbi:MAG: hypothetical protein SXV54_05615 [Chloroflexota bacterium]|nr:hypothetical protein [Chloroflexota bacterium]